MTSKRDRIHSANVRLEHVMARLLMLKRRPRWVLNQLFAARSQLDAVLKGKIK